MFRPSANLALARIEVDALVPKIAERLAQRPHLGRRAGASALDLAGGAAYTWRLRAR
jgi:hypothetical protein